MIFFVCLFVFCCCCCCFDHFDGLQAPVVNTALCLHVLLLRCVPVHVCLQSSYVLRSFSFFFFTAKHVDCFTVQQMSRVILLKHHLSFFRLFVFVCTCVPFPHTTPLHRCRQSSPFSAGGRGSSSCCARCGGRCPCRRAPCQRRRGGHPTTAWPPS